MIRRFVPPVPGNFRGLPKINQAIGPNKKLKNMMINSHAHFGKRRTLSCGVIAQSTKAYIARTNEPITKILNTIPNFIAT